MVKGEKPRRTGEKPRKAWKKVIKTDPIKGIDSAK
jgi:hypothetical protein